MLAVMIVVVIFEIQVSKYTTEIHSKFTVTFLKLTYFHLCTLHQYKENSENTLQTTNIQMQISAKDFQLNNSRKTGS